MDRLAELKKQAVGMTKEQAHRLETQFIHDYEDEVAAKEAEKARLKVEAKERARQTTLQREWAEARRKKLEEIHTQLLQADGSSWTAFSAEARLPWHSFTRVDPQ